MKMSKASDKEWQALVDYFNAMENRDEAVPQWRRVVFGFRVVVDNACDPDKDTLEFKPEIGEAMAEHGKLKAEVEIQKGNVSHQQDECNRLRAIIERMESEATPQAVLIALMKGEVAKAHAQANLSEQMVESETKWTQKYFKEAEQWRLTARELAKELDWRFGQDSWRNPKSATGMALARFNAMEKGQP